jgi:hypothetical protein
MQNLPFKQQCGILSKNLLLIPEPKTDDHQLSQPDNATQETSA